MCAGTTAAAAAAAAQVRGVLLCHQEGGIWSRDLPLIIRNGPCMRCTRPLLFNPTQISAVTAPSATKLPGFFGRDNRGAAVDTDVLY